ncbi:MAG: hypothetical protein Q9N68_12670 [Gammaproteobacteria bacterium]|nr:hypothetical protein [Gammaproteobacteria bacterium]
MEILTMASLFDFRDAAKKQLNEITEICHQCFSADYFDGEHYIKLCEQKRAAKQRLHRIDYMYRLSVAVSEWNDSVPYYAPDKSPLKLAHNGNPLPTQSI